MPKIARLRPFATETALCAAFLARVDARSWIAYKETAGWDILLVRRVDKLQIGIEAKLRLNSDVVGQALALATGHHQAAYAGPDCRAVLVPEGETRGFGTICDHLGINVLRVHSSGAFGPALPILGEVTRSNYTARTEDAWHDWMPWKRHELPEYVPDVAAGASSPIQLTRWKIKALKIAVTIEKRGYVTRADFRHLEIDPGRWYPGGQGWLVAGELGWVPSKAFPDFKKQHPRVYEQVAKDFDKWSLPRLQLQLGAPRKQVQGKLAI